MSDWKTICDDCSWRSAEESDLACCCGYAEDQPDGNARCPDHAEAYALAYPSKTVRVLVSLTLEPDDAGNYPDPEKWDWKSLLDLGPVERASVLDYDGPGC